MLTEALKRKYDKLEKLAKERGFVFEVLRSYRWPDDLSRDHFFSVSRNTPCEKPIEAKILEFSTQDFQAGLNRLMREIKAYPVVK